MQKKKAATAILIVFLATAFILPAITPLIVEAATKYTAIFRPPYDGMIRGTKGPFVLLPGTSEELPGVIDREINLETWSVSRLDFYMKWALPNSFVETAGLFGFVNFSNPMISTFSFPAITMNISLDGGQTYTHQLNYASAVVKASEELPGDFTGYLINYPIQVGSVGSADLFGPNTRIKLSMTAMVLPFVYYAVNYIPAGQLPVPPSDYLGEYGEYVQYDAYYRAEYSQQSIAYTGPSTDFGALAETKDKLITAGDMILNTMQLSGASNEVVGKTFGTDTFIVIYSSQIAFIELLKLRAVVDDPDYLPATKRFIVWMWSKQNTDGSFPFILTDGDQHPWYNSTTDEWYGRDKIDSFSACAISLMRAYYEATGDLDFVNRFWSNIVACKDFVWELIDPVYGVPVDGYHYTSEISFYKSTWNWLHDSCEAYQGLKDYAYLEGVRGYPAEEAYYDGWAESIASNIRLYFWNETLNRYAGMFHTSTGAQDTTFVYNVITPLIYGIETDAQKSISTLQAYLSWGILSGRYLDQKWAADYEVTNEYSGMSCMIFSGFAQLVTQFSYNETWMKTAYIEVTKFLFNNPIYPQKTLLNSAGLLDWVDLVHYTWASESARLVESSAWFIHAYLRTPDMAPVFHYSQADLQTLNETLTTELAYWQDKFLECQSETGISSIDAQQDYDTWVNWLKEEQLYVQWFDFMFLRDLFLSGALGTAEWLEELSNIRDDLQDTTDAINALQVDGLTELEISDLKLLLLNVTAQMNAAKDVIDSLTGSNLGLITEIQTTFDSYYFNITQKVTWLQVKIAQAEVDDVITSEEIDGIEDVKIPLLADLESFLAWLQTVIDLPWWELNPDPDNPWNPGDTTSVFMVGAIAFWAFIGGAMTAPISLAGAIQKRSIRLLWITLAAFLVALISLLILVYGGA